MAQSLPIPHLFDEKTNEQAISGAQHIPWYIWSCLIAIMSGTIGGAWDISWHESVGRDSFWTAPHMFIYFSGILAGLSCAYLILSITFNKNHPLRDSSVTMWGCRGPLGAFIVSWGAAAMITSAPFDNWWHNAYGLDVKILSPPHVLLALGMLGIRFGGLVLALAEMNRAQGAYRAKTERVLHVSICFPDRRQRRNGAGIYRSHFHAQRQILFRGHDCRSHMAGHRGRRGKIALGRHNHDRLVRARASRLSR